MVIFTINRAGVSFPGASVITRKEFANLFFSNEPIHFYTGALSNTAVLTISQTNELGIRIEVQKVMLDKYRKAVSDKQLEKLHSALKAVKSDEVPDPFVLTTLDGTILARTPGVDVSGFAIDETPSIWARDKTILSAASNIYEMIITFDNVLIVSETFGCSIAWLGAAQTLVHLLAEEHYDHLFSLSYAVDAWATILKNSPTVFEHASQHYDGLNSVAIINGIREMREHYGLS